MTKPFIKWAGGKRSIVKYLKDKSHYGKGYNYYEPFVGGGVLFFKIVNSFKYSPDYSSKFYISDVNKELIITYKVIRDDPVNLMNLLDFHTSRNNEEYYYKIRAENYKDYLEIAARFIYLNKAGFNGLYRVNKNGVFNMPYGKRDIIQLYDNKHIVFCNNLLQNVEISERDFSKIYPKKGDFVYFDPPYHKLNSNSFTNYTNNGFTTDDQLRLLNKCKFLNEQGVYFMQSNSNTEFIRDSYKDFLIEEVEVVRNIKSNSKGRAKIKELIIRNYN